MADDFSDILLDTPQPTVQKKAAQPASAAGKSETGVQGTVLRAKIHAENWFSQGDYFELDCGAFEVDSCELQGPPSTVRITAVSTPISSSLRREEKCKAWEDVTLQKIALDIADNAGLTLLYEVKAEIALDRVDQLQQADLPFLQTLCHNYGVSLKVTDKQLVLFDEADYEKRPVVDTFNSSEAKTENNFGGRILSYKFLQDSSDSVSSSTVSYKDPKSGKLVKYTFKPPNAPATGQAINSNKRPGNLQGDSYRDALGVTALARVVKAGSVSDTKDDFSDIRVDTMQAAARQATANAREANKKEWVCELTTVGNPKMVAGVTFEIEGFGVYDGKYIVDEAAHKVGGGYTTVIKGHRALNGY